MMRRRTKLVTPYAVSTLIRIITINLTPANREKYARCDVTRA